MLKQGIATLFRKLGTREDGGLTVVCSKDKEQDKFKGPILPEQRVTGLLSLRHNATIAMSQSPPKHHALSLSHPI